MKEKIKLMMKSKIMKDWIEPIAIAVILALFVRTFIIQAFKIPTGSMKPALNENNRIFVNKYIYRFKDPQRGDIVVFKYPEDPKKDFIKRLIAAGGETLQILDGNIIVNGNLIKEPSSIKSVYYYNRGEYGGRGQKITVPEGYFYFLGDNSGGSRDSRYWGFVPRKYIIGKAVFRYWPPKAIGRIK